MKLPNGEAAIVAKEKIEGYCLNVDNEDGRHKARVFRGVLGITSENAHILCEALITAAREEEAQEQERSTFGRRFVIDFPMDRGSGEAIVRSAWIIHDDEGIPRLTSCYILLRRGK